MFVCLDNQISVHISQKNHPNSLGETRACIILFSWIILIFLTTGFLSLEIPVTCELFVPLWDGFCSLMALGLFWLLFAFVSALERLLKDYAGRFATGDEVYLVWFPASSVFVPANLYIQYAALCANIWRVRVLEVSTNVLQLLQILFPFSLSTLNVQGA